MTGEARQRQKETPARLAWQKDSAGEVCDLSGHFWATLRSHRAGDRVIWSWMITGYENQVLATGQTGDRSAAKRLAEEWDRWVRKGEAVLDSTGNPPAIAENCGTYEPTWPPGR